MKSQGLPMTTIVLIIIVIVVLVAVLLFFFGGYKQGTVAVTTSTDLSKCQAACAKWAAGGSAPDFCTPINCSEYLNCINPVGTPHPSC